MPRGSKPGERRGGRQRGTPNKKTLIKNAVFLAAAADPNRSPLDFMLALMRDPQVPFDLRIDMAAAAAPLVHARPRASGRSRPHPMELRARRTQSAALSGSDKPNLPGGAEKPALPRSQEPDIATRPENAPMPKVAETDARLTIGTAEAGKRGNLKAADLPLDFLLGVMHDPEVMPRQRARAARIAARYMHQPPERPVHLVEDEFGFKIDPVVAKTVRELDALLAEVVREIESREEQRKRGRPLIPYPALYENKKRLGARLREHLESIECPDGYGWLDLEKDEARLRELAEQRGWSKGKLRPDDDAEEAYLITRMEVYRRTPKHEAWCRITKLEQARANGKELTAAEISELDDLRAQFPTAARGWEPTILLRPKGNIFDWHGKLYELRICELEGQRFEQTPLTPAEEREWEVLAREYPECVNETRKIYEFEERRFDQTLTPAEEQELQELARKYPKRVAEARTSVRRWMSEKRAMKD
jgi:uncharacterized protein YnzC (UPF0291/DUF896 family)